MADGGIGHEALDVALADGGERAQHHRTQRGQHDDLLPLRHRFAKGAGQHAGEEGHGGDFGGRGEEGGDGGGRAFIDIGRPHMEGHGGDFEGEGGDDEDDAHHDAGRDALLGREGIGQTVKIGGAGEAIDQRGAVEQQARGQGAQDEVFQPGLGGAGIVTVNGGDDVERQAEKFEAHIERHEVIGRDHHHHAHGGEEHQHGEFEAGEALLLEEIHRQHEAHGGAEQAEHLHEGGEAVGDVLAAEGCAFLLHQHQGGGEEQRAEGGDGDGEIGVSLGQHATHQDGEAAKGEGEFRQGQGPVHGAIPARRAMPSAA